LPYPLPYSDIVDHHIEKKEVSGDSSKKGDKNRVDDFLSLSLCLIEGTHSFRSEVPYESEYETSETKSPKIPFIVSIEIIGK
jgi:hypothetical protein